MLTYLRCAARQMLEKDVDKRPSTSQILQYFPVRSRLDAMRRARHPSPFTSIPSSPAPPSPPERRCAQPLSAPTTPPSRATPASTGAPNPAEDPATPQQDPATPQQDPATPQQDPATPQLGPATPNPAEDRHASPGQSPTTESPPQLTPRPAPTKVRCRCSPARSSCASISAHPSPSAPGTPAAPHAAVGAIEADGTEHGGAAGEEPYQHAREELLRNKLRSEREECAALRRENLALRERAGALARTTEEQLTEQRRQAAQLQDEVRRGQEDKRDLVRQLATLSEQLAVATSRLCHADRLAPLLLVQCERLEGALQEVATLSEDASLGAAAAEAKDTTTKATTSLPSAVAAWDAAADRDAEGDADRDADGEADGEADGDADGDADRDELSFAPEEELRASSQLSVFSPPQLTAGERTPPVTHGAELEWASPVMSPPPLLPPPRFELPPSYPAAAPPAPSPPCQPGAPGLGLWGASVATESFTAAGERRRGRVVDTSPQPPELSGSHDRRQLRALRRSSHRLEPHRRSPSTRGRTQPHSAPPTPSRALRRPEGAAAATADLTLPQLPASALQLPSDAMRDLSESFALVFAWRRAGLQLPTGLVAPDASLAALSWLNSSASWLNRQRAVCLQGCPSLLLLFRIDETQVAEQRGSTGGAQAGGSRTLRVRYRHEDSFRPLRVPAELALPHRHRHASHSHWRLLNGASDHSAALPFGGRGWVGARVPPLEAGVL